MALLSWARWPAWAWVAQRLECLALLGAAAGTVIGLFMGLVGVLFMPLVGAAAGEYLAQKDQKRAVTVGVSTWIGIMVGLIAKVVLAFIMVGIFLAALLF